MLLGIWDSDQPKSGQPYHIVRGIYATPGKNAWVYDDNEEAERRGINGNGTSTLIVKLVQTESDCRLYDDYSGIETDVNHFVAQDSDGNERCRYSICANDW